ncbi:MAG: hypothetical protein COT39_02180 [Parcubacteria group bacterium CG08_land_8_20_14_0_20_48_21]|nr:MAG: hypothetical protein AUK21_01615 [Parcubacteria group bacterium CG2_30_48_51]PIS32874.1 MAG: hypothetical protein COT39_02180 [Parcubacteria group bacterium CG08_land_8_20_14_0_20_48_21]PIW78788.1 MAG: hypothetical protein COZ99_04570 [Parcubacteria group bacterium CG_4_8_14_3_um_filter_48_16]PIY78243.1 MAG: hypothetical protein COY83_00820 [Parcubacteria group bacterium CG_4_10_14_0_8_um_filter_48_154]PJC39698.1 MAG: hypothetical protein CO043_02765 [Parcubacteria group bacterium CG_4_
MCIYGSLKPTVSNVAISKSVARITVHLEIGDFAEFCLYLNADRKNVGVELNVLEIVPVYTERFPQEEHSRLLIAFTFFVQRGSIEVSVVSPLLREASDRLMRRIRATEQCQITIRSLCSEETRGVTAMLAVSR